MVGVPDIDGLVEAARRGDMGAFRQLFQRHRDDVARLVFRMMGPGADVEDIVQDVFIQVHRSLGDFRGDSKFSTWLYRLTVNVVLMARRAARSRPRFEHPSTLPDPPQSGPGPDEEAIQRARAAAFQRLLERLPEKKRVAFVLHELEGLQPGEIAKIVGVPAITVRTRLFYARRELAQMLAQEPLLAQLAAEFGEQVLRPSLQPSDSKRGGT